MFMINKIKKTINGKKTLIVAGGSLISAIACFTLIVRTIFKRKGR